ncbi:LuxR C-terminal-related transcriptional regulator [Streptomyces sp. H39-S7]|nr:LuxR C-terminal-related transcriptional regulator [Streptomyces sp. H39-S7]MCZ4125154.1 LuxR C-terminal-related transcriptional regulator [Streptomyces sp. H39-S7]
MALPTRPALYLRRERLIHHLDQALDTPLTLINGPAGAGKTLLAADWAAGLSRPVAWLTAEAGDQRPGVFWAYVLRALSACGALSETFEVPAEPGQVGHKLLATLAAGLDERDQPVVVVLDEYERVTDPEVAEQLEFVLHHAGRGLRLVLISRTEPLLPLHRYRAAGQLTEIRAAELAFTADEAVTLLELHGLSLPVDAGRALADRTRGWAAGLALCALAARESPDPEIYLKEYEADRSTVADFLLAEVLKRQPERAQDLLLRVCVLDRFSPELADALTGRTDAESLLRGLHRENAFVEHLGHEWYRLHPLFREILRAHLRVSRPGLEPELHRRAAQWLRRSGSLTEALAHGAAWGDWGFTAGMFVDDLAIGQLFTGLRSGELDQVFSGMGPEATGSAADLVRAARDLARCNVERGLSHLDRARERLAVTEPSAAAQLSCALLEASAARLTGSPERAEEAALAAARLQREVPEALLERHPELTAQLMSHVGATRLWAGRFEEARAALTAVTDAPGGSSTVLSRQESMGYLALIDYLNGWIGRVERKVHAAACEAERFSLPQPCGSGIGLLVLAAVAIDRDELAGARALLDEAAQLPYAAHDPVAAAVRATAGQRLLLVSGRPRSAAEPVEAAVPPAAASPWAAGHEALSVSAEHLAQGRPDRAAEILQGVSGDQPACAVEAARMLLTAGRPTVALNLLDSIRGDSRTGPSITVRATLARAQAAQGAGDGATAHRLVAQALLDARRERLRRPFLDARSWIRPFLSTAPCRELAADWLTPGPSRSDAQAPPALVAEDLSGRERDVLTRLAQMMSSEEIAADLYVSVNTVKTHLKSIYRKLAVNRRNEAVRRARELGLV